MADLFDFCKARLFYFGEAHVQSEGPTFTLEEETLFYTVYGKNKQNRNHKKKKIYTTKEQKFC